MDVACQLVCCGGIDPLRHTTSSLSSSSSSASSNTTITTPRRRIPSAIGARRRRNGVVRAVATEPKPTEKGPRVVNGSPSSSPLKPVNGVSTRIGDVSKEIKRVRAQMEENEQVAILMRGLRGQNLSDSQFADENIQLRLVEVDESSEFLPLVYEPASISAYWGKRPRAVATRIVQLLSVAGGFLSRLAWDVINKKVKENEVSRAIELRDIVTSLGPAYIKLGQALSIRPDILSPAAMTELQKLCDKPCSCGNGKATADQLQQDRAMEFLQGLHERYAGLRSQILLMDPFPSTTKIYSLVRQEEKQQEIHSLSSPIPDAAALAAKSANRGNDSKFRKNQLHCDHCGWNNHTKDRCYKLIGYPPKKSGPPKHKESEIGTPPPITQDQYNKLLAMLSKGSIDSNANLAGPINEEDDWAG